MKIHFNKKTYFIFLGLNIILSIQQWPERARGGTPLFETAFSILIAPVIFTLILSPFFAKKEKKVGKDGFTKLMELCSNGNINEVKSEISSNELNLNVQDKGGYTALMYAVASGNIEVVELLLNNGADKNLKTTKDNTALYFAEKNNFASIINLLKSN